MCNPVHPEKCDAAVRPATLRERVQHRVTQQAQNNARSARLLDLLDRNPDAEEIIELSRYEY